MRRCLAGVVFLVACAGSPEVAAPNRLAVVATAPSASPPPTLPQDENGRLPGAVQPRRYALDLDIDPSKPTFNGHVRIEVSVRERTPFVVLHGRDLTATRVEASSATSTHHAGHVAVARSSERGGPNDELVLAFEPPLNVGPAVLDIDYHAPFASGLDGLYRARDRDRDYAFTQFEATDARRAFPCFDEPKNKTPFDLSVRVPRGMIAVANAPESKRADDGDHVRFSFAPTAPLPTYLVALAVGDFDVVEGRKQPFPIRVITTKGRGASARAALEPAAEIVDALARTLDVPYPFAKLDLVSVPDFGAGAMENAGLITFREELLLLDPSTHSPAAVRRRDGVLTHELAHQWFSDLVTMEWWDDLWLNESFATWMTDRLLADLRPAYRTAIGGVKSGLGVMDADALPSARPVHRTVAGVSDAMEGFDGITYEKGAAVIRMLEKAATPERFRAGLKSYLTAHAFGSARTADLVAAVSESAQKPLGAIASSFLEQSGVPTVSVERDCRKDGTTLVLSQYTWSPLGAAPPSRPLKQWAIPLCIREEGKEPACTTMTERRLEVPLARGCGGWVFPNASLASYVRLSFPPTELAKLTRSLGKLDVNERLGVLANAWADARAGQLPIEALLDALRAFDGDNDRVLVQESIDVLDAMGALSSGPDEEARLRELVKARLLPRKRTLGWGASDALLGRRARLPRPATDDETHLLRLPVLFALGELGGDEDTLKEADALAQAWLRDPKSIDPETGALALELGSRRADASRLEALIAAAKKADDPAERIAALRAMGGFDDPNLVTRALDFAFSGEVNLKDIRYVMAGAMRHARTRDVLLAWVEAHWQAATHRLGGHGARLLVGPVFGLCDAKAIEEARAFYKARPIEGGARSLDEALEHAGRCASLAEGLRPALRKALPAPRPPRNGGTRPK